MYVNSFSVADFYSIYCPNVEVRMNDKQPRDNDLLGKKMESHFFVGGINDKINKSWFRKNRNIILKDLSTAF